MKILLTNDDGPFGPGLTPLCTALRALGEVDVVCPDRERSGAGHAITVLVPLRSRHVTLPDGSQGAILTGTPADCVKFAVLKEPAVAYDLVVSGVNLGINAGADLFYSGTVAAALEGALMGIPSVAFSTDRRNGGCMQRVVHQCMGVLPPLLRHEAPAPWAANVNVPLLTDRPPCMRVTRQAHGFAAGDVTPAKGARGRVHYWVDAQVGAPGAPDDSDIMVLRAGDISVTPLRADLTDEVGLLELRRLVEAVRP